MTELIGLTFFVWALVAITVALVATFIEGWRK